MVCVCESQRAQDLNKGLLIYKAIMLHRIFKLMANNRTIRTFKIGNPETKPYLISGLGSKRLEKRSTASGIFSTKNRSMRSFTIFTSRSILSPYGCLPPVTQKKRTQPKLNKSTARVWRLWRSCSGACQPELPQPMVNNMDKLDRKFSNSQSLHCWYMQRINGESRGLSPFLIK